MVNKQTILIAGATGSIGGGAALALAKRGARVVLFGRSVEKLKTKVNLIRAALDEARQLVFSLVFQANRTNRCRIIILMYAKLTDKGISFA